SHSYSSLRDSSSHNGEGEGSLSTNASTDGEKLVPKPTVRHSISSHHHQPGRQKSPYGFPESPRGGGRRLKTTERAGPSEDGMEVNVCDLSYQPPPQHIDELQKRVGVAGVEEQVRRNPGLEAGKGHDIAAQQQTFPSLLQEVLQGYHTDKRYRHTENSPQQLQTRNTHHQFQNMPCQHPHSRHPNSMTESVRPHPLAPQRGMGIDCHTPNEPAALGKPYQNQKHEGEICMDQDPHRSWYSGGIQGSKEMPWVAFDKSKMIAFDKSKMVASQNPHTTNMQQSSEPSLRPHSKHINLSDYALPPRKQLSNELNTTSAVQQLLLQEADPAAGNEASVGQTRPHTPSSSPLPSLSSLERRSVICDFSPSRLTTHDRESISDRGDKVSNPPQAGSSEASVIQQSFSTSILKQEDKQQKVNKAMLRQEALKTNKEIPNCNTCDYTHPFTKEITIQHQNRIQQPSGLQLDTIPDPPRASSGGKGTVKALGITTLHPQQTPQSRFQSYFQGVVESSNHSAGVGGFGLRDTGERTVRMSPQRSHQLSHHHHLPLSQPQNPQLTNKLQMYPYPRSLQHLHSLNDRDWTGSNNDQLSSQDMMSPDSGHNQRPAAIRSKAGVLANLQQLPQVPPQGSYYDIGKIWGPSLPERENEGTMEGEACQTNENPAPVVPPGSVVLTPTLPAGSKHLESKPSRAVKEEVVKAFHLMSTSIPIKQSDCSSSSSGSCNSANLAPQGKAKIGGSGDTNPLINRRRVRSFISPIPAKRQHQDTSQQQQQRGVSSMYPSHPSNSDKRHNVDDGQFSPDTPHLKAGSSNSSLSPSSSLGKTKVLQPRKERGLKLEAIVQKITPIVQKPTTDDNESDTDSTSNHLSSLSHTEMTSITDLKDHLSSVRGNFSRIGADSGSCLPYLNEGISLEEIISYRGVDETGPLPPTAYPCDPHQATHILKCDVSEKQARPAVGDLEPVLDFGIGAPGTAKSERHTARDGRNDELRMAPDFTLLGPLPPPPPLPRPVQASSPPSSSALSDIQRFTTTYQQLETRRGEHSAATLLRQKLQESGMGLGLDDYSGRDYLETKSHHQNSSHCLLSIPPHSQLHQQHTSAGNTSSAISQSPYTDTKHSDSMVPKGYFPSGKKRGRPVGSVNKQKRAQSQNVSLNASPVTPIPTPASTAMPQTEVQSTTPTTSIDKNDSDDKDDVSQTEKEEFENEEMQPEMEAKPCRQRGSNEDGTEEDEVVSMPRQRRTEIDVFDEEVVKSAIEIRGNLSSSGVFPTCSKSVFAPYVHVERKLEEVGNVCTIVNAEDEKKKGESGEERGGRWAGKEVGGGCVAPIHLTLTSQLTRKDGEREKVKENKSAEQVNPSLIQASPTGKALPSSEYVISGPVMSETNTFGHLLCCLCKKWANYKDLGDLYGPYYPPEYATRLPKNPPVIRQSLGTTSVASIGALSGTAAVESAKQILSIELQTCKPTTNSSLAGNQATDTPAATTDTVSPMSVVDVQSHSGNCENGNKGSEDWQPAQEPTTMSEVWKQEEQPRELLEQPQNQQQMEDALKRPQHRKLTSHPRFKRRHKSSEDLPKTGPTNSKALLPFQPPPPLQLPNQGPSDPSAPLFLLPRVPLDPEELWVHEGCIVWASGVYQVNGRLYGLQEALDGARDTCCSHCEAMGSTLGCYSKGCTLRYHYLCAMEAGCSLNEDNFSLRCPKHKFPQNNRPVKSVDGTGQRDTQTEEGKQENRLLRGGKYE
ncbi:hypothetical protein AAFF_G00260830, partial [Aldrovandia affinis]